MMGLVKSAVIGFLIFIISGFILVAAFSSCLPRQSVKDSVEENSMVKGRNIPLLDASVPERIELATFALG